MMDIDLKQVHKLLKDCPFCGSRPRLEQLIQIYSSQQDTISHVAFFNSNAKVVYTGFRIKD